MYLDPELVSSCGMVDEGKCLSTRRASLQQASTTTSRQARKLHQNLILLKHPKEQAGA